MDITIDELYNEYHYLNKTNSSQLLYYRNIINYSTFCIRDKQLDYNALDIDAEILERSLVNEKLKNILICVINALETFNYDHILILYK